MSDTHDVTRSAVINAPASEVYAHIVDFHRWEAWSPWKDLDPNMDTTYSGADLGVGQRYEWSGNRKAGAGSMTISEAVLDDHVKLDLAFLKPFKSTANITLQLEPQGDTTRVVWLFEGDKTTASKIMGIFTSMDKMIGPDFERGLDQLKAVAESS